ncbi:MAG TPA: LD-carboxypeptidase [bacterium]|nr:LD-carboxypeptidase [bacterium]
MQPIIPRPLQPGGTIGIVAPASGADQDELQPGIEYFGQKGYTVQVAPNVTSRTHFTAGNRQSRLEALVNMFQDEDVEAVLCARGGDGAIHLLPDLLDRLSDTEPKPFCGYSDITLLQLALYERFGWVSFSGPMVATEFSRDILSDYAETHFWSLLTQTPMFWNLTPEPGWETKVWRAGSANGPLLGGCLSLICALLGTDYLPDFSEAVLVIEDTEEEPKSIDRMLHQLRLAGIFGKISGLLVGQFINCFPSDESADFTLQELIMSAARGFDFPILANYPYGHNLPDRLTLPLGVRLRFDTSPMRFNLVF